MNVVPFQGASAQCASLMRSINMKFATLAFERSMIAALMLAFKIVQTIVVFVVEPIGIFATAILRLSENMMNRISTAISFWQNEPN
jgi:hypothetical protein